MTYRGYMIVRELKGWQQSEVNDDGSIGKIINFIEDNSGEIYTVFDPLETLVTAACTSIKEAKARIDDDVRQHRT